MSVAIVIPTYNLKDHIERCLNSVMNQTVAPDEIIVVDDGSTDNTCELVEKYSSVTLIKQKNNGPASARNLGVQKSKSEWIAFLDGDDEFLPTKIEEIKLKLQENLPENIVMIGNDQEEGVLGSEFSKTLLHQYFDPSRNVYEQLLRGCFLSTASMIVRRNTFLEVGGMDTNLPSAQDYDVWLRLAQKGELVFINKVLTRCIEREGSISFNPKKRYACLLLILAKHRSNVSFKDYLVRLLRIHYEVASMFKGMGKYFQLFQFVLISPLRIAKYLIL